MPTRVRIGCCRRDCIQLAFFFPFLFFLHGPAFQEQLRPNTDDKVGMGSPTYIWKYPTTYVVKYVCQCYINPTQYEPNPRTWNEELGSNKQHRSAIAQE